MGEIKSNSKYHVPNLVRALDVFELLSENPQGLTISEISNQLSIPRNSIFRITTTLFNNGYIDRNDELRKYTLSFKMLTVGMKALTDPALIEVALPVMHNLQKKYKETVPIGIIKDDKGVILEEVTGTHAFRFVLEPGKSFNLHTSAPSKAIIAYLPKHDQDILINNIKFKRFTDRTIIKKQDFLCTLQEVKKQGYAIDHAEEIEGMHCLGAPIFNRKGLPIAAVWITGPSIRIKQSDFDTIGRDIRYHADKISKNLGFTNEIYKNRNSIIGKS
ncbi:IclR family transcriptional regulator [Candidatus Neomarinimicrobiota bacterium]